MIPSVRRPLLLGLPVAVLALAAVAGGQNSPRGTAVSGAHPRAPSSPAGPAGPGCRDTINFNQLATGLIVSSVTSRSGLGPILVTGRNPYINAGNTNAAIIFDSSNPTGGDTDLGSPHFGFGGPGVGAGGAPGSPFQNDTALHKLLILGEDLNDGNNDGLVDDPDDANVLGVGGELELDFSQFGEVYIERMTAIDLDLPEPLLDVDFYTIGGSLITTHTYPSTGNGGVVDEFLGVGPVGKMVINLTGSGGFDNLVFECWRDCNGNGVQDSVDIAIGTSEDCNGNGIPDECDLDSGGSQDCNGNSVPDECDIAGGFSQDCNGNGVPDECEDFEDCNCNDIPDECETDCNGNGIPDECDLAYGTSQDCNDNGIPDECDIAGGGSSDDDMDGIPDECCIPPPPHFTVPGLYLLHDGNVNPNTPPNYGLRLDGLFGNSAHEYTFSFDEPGTEMFMRYDGVGIHIWGRAYGGRDIGPVWDPADQSFVTIDFVYAGPAVDAGIELQIPNGTANGGTLLWEATNQVFNLSAVALNNVYWQFDGSFVQGWLALPSGHVNTMDWLYLAEPIKECVPEDEPIDCNGNGIYDACDIADGTSLDVNMNGIPDECEP